MQTTLTRVFIVLESESHGLSEYWEGISRKPRKFERFFRPKTGGLQKQKRSSPKLRLIFRPKSEIQTFFPPKNRWSKKKRKKIFTEIETDFSTKIGNSNDMYFTTSAPNFLWGGLFSIFHQKSASKAPKTCDFAYFTSQWRGSRGAPPPPLATLLLPKHEKTTIAINISLQSAQQRQYVF